MAGERERERARVRLSGLDPSSRSLLGYLGTMALDKMVDFLVALLRTVLILLSPEIIIPVKIIAN